MKLEDDYMEYGRSTKGNGLLIGILACVAIGMAAVIVLVIIVNKDKLFVKKPVVVTEEESQSIDLGNLISGSNLVSGDLDIWEEYMQEEEDESGPVFYEEIPSEDDPSEGGNKTLIERKNGRSEWVMVSKYLPLNEYDEAGFAMLNGRMIYYEEGVRASYTGVEISKYQGYVDFNEVKRDGIDYVILRAGQRGYSTGQIVADDYFTDNLKRAADAGLDVGVSFLSQAVNTEEAVEEAEFILQYLQGQMIRYPVVFDMQHVANDSARIDILTKEEKTQIAKAFLTRIEEEGYIGVIRADKEWMFDDINYAAVSNYGIWLVQHKDLPDYPYRFQMWNYSDAGSVNGINGLVGISISFIDYTVK